MELQERLKAMTPNERRNFLEDNARSIEHDQIYRKYLTEEERQDASKHFALTAIQLEVETEKFEVQRQIFKEKEKGLKSANKINLRAIRSGYVEKQGDVFCFDDQDAGMMETYDLEGNLIESRKLRPEERQTNLLSINHKSA